MQAKEGRIFYGWYIVAVAFVANFMATGTSFYMFNAILQPLCQLRGWSRTQVNMAMVMASFFVYLSQFVYGTVVARTGPKLLMACGPLVAGAACIWAGHAETLPFFYLAFVLMYMGDGAYGAIVANTAVSNWFLLKRGRAMGLATSAISLSGAVVPLAAMFLILKTSLVHTFLIVGLAIMAVCPLVLLVVRNWPEEHGLAPDGGPAPAKPPEPAKPVHIVGPQTAEAAHAWPPGRLVRTPAFWKLGFAYGLTSIGVVGVMSQLKPFLSDHGFSDMAAMSMMAATAFLGGVGKYVWGALCDRFEPRLVAVALLAANALGLALALWHGQAVALALFIVIFGFAMGGVMSTYPIIIAGFFGRKAFPSVLRFAALFLVLEASGFYISGQSHDRTGSYDAAYYLYVALDVAAVFLMWSLKAPADQDGK